jgi:hypothetical protein
MARTRTLAAAVLALAACALFLAPAALAGQGSVSAGSLLYLANQGR